MTNRIAQHYFPEPDPKKNSDDGTDLAKIKLPDTPKDSDVAKPVLPDASVLKSGEASGTPTDATVSDALRAIRERHLIAERAGKRVDLSHDDLEVMAKVANRIRDSVDQSTAPPIDHDLVYLATWNRLPHDLAVLVQKLGLRYDTWKAALEAEGDRAIAIEDAARNN